MIRASIYGRLGADPVERETRNGKAMVTASLAVSAGRPDVDEETQSFNLIAFGRVAEALARHVKGDLIGCMGPLYRNRYTAHNGDEREGWSLTVESIVSARTVRPSGGRTSRRREVSIARADASADNGRPFDDPIP
ncbi:MAG: single-stranded DNA-binding protein [bacterium]